MAADLKRRFKKGEPHRWLPDKTIFLMFFDKSTRTRNSFEAGITQLGGHGHFLTADAMQVSHGESPKDTGIILSRYGHAIAIRHDLIPGEGNAYMREVARWADVPVINMQCDVDHPCQTLADLMTIREKLGRKRLKGKKLAVSWAYAPSYAKPLSVPQGLIMLMPRFGMDVTLAHPPEYFLMPETLEAARRNAKTGRHDVRGGGRHGRRVRGRRRRDPQELGLPRHDGEQAGGVAAHREAVHEVDLRRAAAQARAGKAPSTCTRCRRTAATR